MLTLIALLPRNRANPILAATVVVALASCDSAPRERQPSSPPAAKADYRVSLSAEAVDAKTVKFVVSTNAPVPKDALIEVSLADQKDEDTWIGEQKKVVVDAPKKTFTFDTSEFGKALPSGAYDAEVTVYLSDELDPVTNALPMLEATDPIRLGGSGESTKHAQRKAELQKWVMLNIDMNQPWHEREMVARLGKYQKGPASLSHLHDAYYFPDVDMTLIVNRLRGEITVWREGRATK
jgi:hypothetical protein